MSTTEYLHRVYTEVPLPPIFAHATPSTIAAQSDNKAAHDLQHLVKMFPDQEKRRLDHTLRLMESVEKTAELAQRDALLAPPFSPGGTYPHLLAFDEAEVSKKARVMEFRMMNVTSGWSQKINMDAMSDGRVALELQEGVMLNFSVSVSPGSGIYHNTKFITIQPMYWFVNQSSHPLDFRQYQSDILFRLQLGQEVPFYWSSSTFTTRNPGLVVRISSQDPSIFNAWSSSFQLDEVGDYHIKLTEKPSPQETVASRFFDVDIFLRRGCQYVVFRDGEPPFELENLSQQILVIRQEGNSEVVVLKPGMKIPYTWPSPSGPYHLQAAIRAEGNNGSSVDAPWRASKSYDIRKIGPKPTLTCSMEDSSGNVLIHFVGVEVFGNGPTRVVKFSDSTSRST